MKNFTKISLLLLLISASLLIFQAYDIRPSSDDPNIDRMPDEMRFSHSITPIQQPLVLVTGSDGYDNFNLGINFAEVQMSTNPLNPADIFNAYNTNSGHHTINGIDFASITPPVPNTAGDPWSANDSLGNLYYITLNSGLTASWVIKSTNFGLNWGTAVTACTGNDRETISCDATGGPFAGYVYCGETPGNFSRSTDGGLTFQQTASMTNNLPGFMSCVGAGPTGISGGAVYVITSTGSFNSPTFTLYRSTDGGASFANMSVQGGWINTVGTIVGGRNSYLNMRLRPYPFIYADNSFGPNRGRVYIFYCANNPGGDGNKPSIYLRYSDNGCASFSSPVLINDDATPTANAHFQEAGYCDKSTGRLYCQWMDTRNTPTSDSAEIFASLSTDGGVTWASNQKISTAKMKINCTTCGGGGVPAYQGDYSGASANGTVGNLSWTDFRAGTFASYFGYFPDYAMKLSPTTSALNGVSDSSNHVVSIPGVKLYTDNVRFSAAISPVPSTGTVLMQFFNRNTGLPQDSLTALPDSLKFRITTLGGVTAGTYTVTVKATGSYGTPVHVRTITLTVSPIGIHNISSEVPANYYLYQNYPNPFNPTTNIKFDLVKSGNVRLVIYSLTGQEVSTPVNSNYSAGRYNVDINAENLASGIYFYKLETPEFTSIRRMILLK